MKKQSFKLIFVLILIASISAISSIGASKSTVKNFAAENKKSDENHGAAASAADRFLARVNSIYQQAGLAQSGLNHAVFKKALIGYYNLKKSQLLSAQKAVITIIDFSKKSSQKRLWIVDLKKNKLLFHTLVAHGKGSGLDLATNFSNRANSHQSSLGFYVTSDTYQEKHGLSMRLKGMDEGFNTNAMNRAVVVHGADYVSESFLKTHGRLGRSHGCPALPSALTRPIINLIKGQTCLFINGPAETYNSNFLDQNSAVRTFLSTLSTTKSNI
ncbi:MAG: murein L,D-transpeptidase catalytic domain family protein [Bacteroidetes bacterium]|nr:murein L,D-transpeptidase catalytic domain family protein [Bacteroidota bacterium]